MKMKMTTAKVILSYAWAGAGKKLDDKDLNDNEAPIADLRKIKESLALVAKNELREDTSTKEACLKQFKEWISQNRDIENCITDDNFLLRFLRTKKFSLPMAQQMLLKYLNLRKTFKHFTYDLDYKSPKLMELVNSGYIVPSPIRDELGRRVILYFSNNFDPYKYSSEDMARIHMLTYETLMNDEINQILGFAHIAEAKAVSMAHITLWSPTEFATIMKWGEQSIPMRHKAIHGMNMPAAVRYAYDFVCTRVSQKIVTRIKLHNNMETMQKHVDSRILPKEYGGDIPLAEMIEMWKRELEENREKVLALDKMNLLSDQGIIRRRTKQEDKTGSGSLPGSFRKLELD